jgi:OFA family oxalate/formate antiporter-like MFS transporter
LNNRRLTLAASMLVTFVLGSVHAFSVFIAPLEALLTLPRAEISLIYSFALVAITLAVLLGYRFYGSLAPWRLVGVTCGLAAVGLALASTAAGWWQLFVGYSLVFGFCNGVGYGYSLQLVGRAMPESRGIAMAAVTAAYAVGSVAFAEIIAWRIAGASVAAALLSLAAALLCCGLVAATMLRVAGANYGCSAGCAGTADKDFPGAGLTRFWVAYMSSVFSGLMAIGHAAGIALSKNASLDLATRAAVAIGIGSALGGFAAGWMLGRWPMRGLLVGLPMLSTLGLLSIALVSGATEVVLLLSLVGFSYGAVIAVYPVAIAERFGEYGPWAYGRVFTAWGLAGLLAPWMAGLIYDLRGGYDTAMLIAAGIAVLSAVCAATLRLEQSA